MDTKMYYIDATDVNDSKTLNRPIVNLYLQ
jgi:hypothetical protein